MDVSFNLDIKITKVLYVIMMSEEITDIVKKYNFELDTSITNSHKDMLKGYTAKYKELNLILVTPDFDPLHKKNCYGTEISFLVAYLGIKHYSPDLVVSFGYAGSNGLFPTLPLK